MGDKQSPLGFRAEDIRFWGTSIQITYTLIESVYITYIGIFGSLKQGDERKWQWQEDKGPQSK